MALVPRGHLGSCHYERSINCHRERSVAICWQWDCRAVHSARLAMTRTAGKCRTGKEIASTTPQMWLVAGSHLGFAKTSCWGSQRQGSQTRTATSVELARRLRQSLRFFAMTRVVG